MNMKEIKFNVGGIWERSEWYIYCNYVINEFPASEEYCKHCYQNEQHQWVCPFVVVAINEGGHNSTGVCLECIMEAGEDNIIEP